MLSKAAIAALAEFPQDMFVLPCGETWPPQKPGFLDVFSGERGVAAALARRGHWSLCVDLAHGPGEDVMDPKLQRRLKLQAACDFGCVPWSWRWTGVHFVLYCNHPAGAFKLSSLWAGLCQ